MILELHRRRIESTLAHSLARHLDVGIAIVIRSIPQQHKQQQLENGENNYDEWCYRTMAILHTVPFLPSAVEVFTR